MPRSVLAALMLALLAVPAAAGLKQVHYVGIHPLPKSEGGGICYIEGPHIHVYDADRIQYRDHRGANYFVGDPVAYGYDGPRYAYKGHHPIHVAAVVGDDDPADVYCYISGPHFHYFAPPEGPEFKLAGGAYFYVADPPRAYVEARPAMLKINTVYQPLVYERPVITVDAPGGWNAPRPELAGPPAGGTAPAPAAPAPGISAGAPLPLPRRHLAI